MGKIAGQSWRDRTVACLPPLYDAPVDAERVRQLGMPIPPIEGGADAAEEISSHPRTGNDAVGADKQVILVRSGRPEKGVAAPPDSLSPLTAIPEPNAARVYGDGMASMTIQVQGARRAASRITAPEILL